MESKVVLKTGTRLYIDYIIATIIGNVSNLQGFISLEEINTSRLLRNSFFIRNLVFLCLECNIYMYIFVTPL